MAATVLALGVSAAPAQAYDFDNGYAPIDVIIPGVVPTLFGNYFGAMQASHILRITTMITGAWFDATAPYHPTAIGVYSDLGRRPASESATNANINIACFYAAHEILVDRFPAQKVEWDQMLLDVGLDPDDDSTDPTSPVGLGNLGGQAWVDARAYDGMNSRGNEGGCQYHCQPFADYTGFEPKNTPYDFKEKSHWQPDLRSASNGMQMIQGFENPQWAVTETISGIDPEDFEAPKPKNSDWKHHKQKYKKQAKEVLDASRDLTIEQKLTSELFDNKITGLGFSALFLTLSRGLSLMEFIHLDFLTNAAAFDTGIAIWRSKWIYSAVRPDEAIHFLYEDEEVEAWGGPGLGTVDDMPGEQWRAYLFVAPHPEYPSGSASFCSAHVTAARRFFGGDDTLGWPVPFPAGSSFIEPGVTPPTDTVLFFPTFTDFEERCGLSRFWGGVHFLAAVEEGHKIGREVGDLVTDFVEAHIDGTYDGGGGCD
jgi:hypothetical protein